MNSLLSCVSTNVNQSGQRMGGGGRGVVELSLVGIIVSFCGNVSLGSGLRAVVEYVSDGERFCDPGQHGLPRIQWDELSLSSTSSQGRRSGCSEHDIIRSESFSIQHTDLDFLCCCIVIPDARIPTYYRYANVKVECPGFTAIVYPTVTQRRHWPAGVHTYVELPIVQLLLASFRWLLNHNLNNNLADNKSIHISLCYDMSMRLLTLPHTFKSLWRSAN